MKIICVYLQKGGVGKTSLSGAVGLELQSYGKTIMIDCDAQSNLSSWFLGSDDIKHEFADYLFDYLDLRHIIQVKHGVSIIPNFGIGGRLREFVESKLPNSPNIFCGVFSDLRRLGYEYIVCDLSPSFSPLEKSLLLWCNEVISPITPNQFGIEGLEIFSNELHNIRKKSNYPILYNKIIINAIDNSISYHKKVLSDSDKLKPLFNFYNVPIDQAFGRSQATNIDLRRCGLKLSTQQVISNLTKDLSIDY
jgi:chromosome partitioning protein